MTSKIPASMRARPIDQRELDLQARWHETKNEWEAAGFPDSGKEHQAFRHADKVLTTYLWDRTIAEIEADRRKHPKARRNAPVQRNHEKTRHLP